MTEEQQLKKQLYKYVQNTTEGTLDRFIYNYYKVAGRKGLFEFVREYNQNNTVKFPLSATSAERIALVEKNVSQFLPWDKYPHISRTTRRKIYDSKNRDLLINRIIKGEEVSLG